MKRILPKFICVLLALAVLLCCMALSACAEGSADLSKTGSVAVTVTADGSAVRGASFSAYFVAAAIAQDGETTFEFTDIFSGFGGKVGDIQTSEQIASLAEYVKSNNISALAEATTDENGKIKFDGLVLGAYLIVQTGAADGYGKCEPFLVCIPYYENGEWIYDADASPKAETEKLTEITIRKVWNDGEDASSHESVSVNLLLNGETVETVILGNDNDWTAVLSDMPQSDSYSVEETNVPDGYKPTYSGSGTDFTVTNSSTLIKTGQLIWPIPVLSAVGLALVMLGIAAVRRSKNDA